VSDDLNKRSSDITQQGAERKNEDSISVYQ
jgi:hypothetical protein